MSRLALFTLLPYLLLVLPYLPLLPYLLLLPYLPLLPYPFLIPPRTQFSQMK